jgi:hypothetical protein
MQSSQTALAANFPSFIESFVPLEHNVRTAPYPFKMTSITTDAYLQKATTASSQEEREILRPMKPES